MKTPRFFGSRWSCARLGDEEFFRLIMGQSPPSSSYNKEGRGVPFFQGKADFGELYPVPSTFCTEPTRIAEPKDVLISVRAPVGPTNIADRRCGIGRGLAAIRCSAKVMPLFLLYVLRSVEEEISNSVRDQGGGFTSIRRAQLASFEVPAPPLPEQTRIVTRVEQLTRGANEARQICRQVLSELDAFVPALLYKTFRGEL